MSRGRLDQLADRAVAWFVTGPAGRFTAFVIDLGAYWLQWVRGSISRRVGRS